MMEAAVTASEPNGTKEPALDADTIMEPKEEIEMAVSPSCDEIFPEPGQNFNSKCCHILELLKRSTSDGVKNEQMVSFIHFAVYEQLKNWGIDMELPSTRGRPKSRKSNSSKFSRLENGSNRLVDAKLNSLDVSVKVPILIKETCDFLRQHVTTEGIFRKSGSASRVQTLMQRFAILEKDEEFYFSPSDTVFDVATVLKQYLREMEMPLIPYEIHGLFRRCWEVSSECSREAAVMLCTCLLSELSISILTYLIEFLNDVVSNSDRNKMSVENLAIVIGPNIMPVELKKSEKVKELEHERKFIETNTKIVEMLIRNGGKLGCLSEELEKKIETDFLIRGSEDELENEGFGRRKKRRSGSLTRVLGFLRKVASNRTGDTPAQTPDFSDFTHTPVMKSSKRRCLDENIFSLQKKKSILEGIRKNGLTVKDDEKRFAHISDTPNSIAGFITCPSPVCLNPSPLKMDWKQTPNTARFKNLVTPSLLRRKDKHVTDLAKNITPFSAPAKPAKTRLGLGKKSAKKQTPIPVLTDSNGSRSREVKRVPSTVSIQKLNKSPTKVTRASSTRIPRPEKMNLRKSNSSCRFPITSPKDVAISDSVAERSEISSVSGEYVRLSPSAHITDVKNDAFIASKISCLEDTLDLLSGQENVGQANGAAATSETNSSPLRLTPLIREINTLTLTAQELTLSGLRRKRSTTKNHVHRDRKQSPTSAEKPPPIPSRSTRRRSSSASVNKARLQSPPTGPRNGREAVKVKRTSTGERRMTRSSATTTVERKQCENDSRTKAIRQVEDKFVRAMNETKIMRIQSERSAKVNSKAVNLHRRFSVQDKGLSPSQRRIMSNASRRRSHELSRPNAATPNPLNELNRLGINNTTPGSISRSPNRCTLKRGRPNTLRSGLARPSPASSRNNSTLGPQNGRASKSGEDFVNENCATELTPDKIMITQSPQSSTAGTPMRRMSSVQELVQLMENVPEKKARTVQQHNSFIKPGARTEPVPVPKQCLSRRNNSVSKFIKPSPVPSKHKSQKIMAEAETPKLHPSTKTRKLTRESSEHWVPASNFNFENQRTRFLNRIGNHNGDRDSIQALKTMNAGKVSENVKLFDQMSGTRKSPAPGKSLIPRYVALHRQESFCSSRNRSSLARNISKSSF